MMLRTMISDDNNNSVNEDATESHDHCEDNSSYVK